MQTLISKMHHGGPNRGYDIEYDGDNLRGTAHE